MKNLHEHRSSNVCEGHFEAEDDSAGELDLSLRIRALACRICDVYCSDCRILKASRNRIVLCSLDKRQSEVGPEIGHDQITKARRVGKPFFSKPGKRESS